MTDPARDGQTLVFIPTFNDVALLPTIIEEVLALDDNYVPLVIDDGSSPRLLEAALPNGCLLFSMPVNMGLGMCTHVALDHAVKYGYGAMLRIDSDGQHPVAMIPDLLLPIRNGDADMVIGTRENHGEGSGFGNFLRNLVKSYFSKVAAWITKGGVPRDVNSGFFALNQEAVGKLSLATLERFPEPQMLILAHKDGLRISEVVISQSPRQHGKTTLSFSHAARLIYRFSIFAAAEIVSFRR
ncbi:MAG: glycosyltransferase [Rhodospirillaceae bacterium]|jgi:glycosyltransferase involved in cell wall biosynthesis|nr:glycosyltransferase [Rhodospirillaceae bacterium]MBT5191930.1 glycosyltransferase [Rhodospirillaceae bacterium]MBT6428729.1 glycosyltransferase [Rhodospirillaceae bacterium]